MRGGRIRPDTVIFQLRRLGVSVVAAVALSSVVAPAVLAQTATVRGFVRDADDGLPLVGVNVILRDADGNVFGNATNIDGFYTVSRLPGGSYGIRISFIGYELHRDTLVLSVPGVVDYNVEMTTSREVLDEILVETDREDAGAAAVAAGLQTVRPEDVERIPTPDVAGDLVSYLQTIPGVVSTGDQGGQLFVRGGEPSQNLVLLDGMIVYQPFHLLGFYSAFPVEIMNTTDVYAGGFGARYGGRLSSVIDISSRSGSKRRFGAMASLAPFVSGARLEGPLVKDRASILVSGRFSVIDRGAERLIDEPLPYAFDDQFAKLHVTVSQNHQASVTALRTYDRGTIAQSLQTADNLEQIDQIVWHNTAVGARYVLLPTKFPVYAEILLSRSEVSNEFGPSLAPTRESRALEYSWSTNVTHYLGRTDLNWGGYVRTANLESSFGGRFQNLENDKEFVTEAGVYLEPDFALDIGSGLSLQPGIRLQTFPSKSRTFVEPRIRAVLEMGAHRLSVAAGTHHQEIIGLSDRRDAGDVFTAWTSTPFNRVSSAVHLVGGYHIRLPFGVEFSVEGYLKDLKALSTAEWTAFPRFSTNVQPADGSVQGVDLRLEWSRPHFYGFLNYGFANVDYVSQQRSLPIWFGVDELEYSPPHDRTHQANALASVDVRRFELTVRWQYGSGLPFSQSLGFDEFILVDGPKDIPSEAGNTRVLYGLPYGGRLPDYHRLDVSLEKAIAITPEAEVTLQTGLTNAYDRNNLFYIDLFTLRRVDQLPLIPSFGLKIEYR